MVKTRLRTELTGDAFRKTVRHEEVKSVLIGDGRGKVPLEYTGMVDAFRIWCIVQGSGANYVKKKKQLRFRIPWIRPKQISNSHTKLDTNVNESIQRPPFVIDRKMVFGTSSSTKKDIKIVNSAEPAVTKNLSSTSTISPDKTVSVITLAGENKGATMQIGSSSKKESSIHIHRAYKTNQTQETTTDEEDENSRNDSMEKAFVNSNIQSINNSMMLHGSINGRDPGVRVILPQQPSMKPMETSKGEVVNKLSYRPQPVVRRRCLRGLLLEPSDSESDNPHKPRRHGCKVRCGEIRKD